MKKFLVAMGVAAFAFVGCGDDSSSSSGPNDESGVESPSSSNTQSEAKQSSSSEKRGKSSSSVIESSSSSVKSESTEKSSSSEKLSEISSGSADEVESSSSGSDVPQSYAEAKVMPSGTYDCSKYSCFTTEYLNQEFLESGKYGEILDERDGQVYKTVQIGEQVWMAQNLNYYDSTSLSVKNKSWCYNDSAYYCEKYGRLYTWAAAIDSAKIYRDHYGNECGYGEICSLPDTVYGICPPSWRLPSNVDWNALFRAVGGKSVAGETLKSQSGWASYGSGTDVAGFSALPVGLRFNNGDFYAAGYTFFWSATDGDVNYAWRIYLDVTYESAYLDYELKYDAFSVRCVKD